MRSFAYCAPTSLAEALAWLASRGTQARPFAGGTDLLVQMRLGLFEPDLLVDLKKVPELSRFAISPEGLTIGAAVPLARIAEHPGVAASYPALVDAASIIGGVAIRERATLGGNLCNAAPSADSVPAMIVLGATCTIAGPQGTRSLPVEAFCTGPRQTVLALGELLVSIHFPPPALRAGARYLRFTPRREMDIAVAGVGASVVLSDDGRTVTAARVALAAVAPRPLLVEAASAALVGREPDEEALAEAAALAGAAAHPIADVRGSIAQRRHLVGVLTRRALRGAVQRARGERIHDAQG